MLKLNSALFAPLSRIENAARRAAGILTTTAKMPKDCELVRQEIREIREALEEFKAAVERDEETGSAGSGLRSHGGA